VDTKNIRIRFQELRESEVERLYELLKHGTSHFSLFHVTKCYLDLGLVATFSLVAIA
jgi:hypothetical protein